MIRSLLFVSLAVGVLSQATGGQNTTQQCGGTTGFPCPSPSGSPSAAPTKLPCCIDPARCVAGQVPCPSMSPALNTTGNCCTTAYCYNVTGLPPCPGIYTPPPTPAPSNAYNNTCCTTAQCVNITGLAPCQYLYSPPPTPAPSQRASVSISPSGSRSPSFTPRPSSSASGSPSAVVLPSSDPTQRVVPSSDPTKEPAPSADPTQRVVPSSDPTKEPAPSSGPSTPPTRRPAPSSEPSAPPTQRPAPSSEPTAPPTQRPAPSELPTKAPAPSAYPTRQPAASAYPTARPTRLPAASFLLQATRSAAPTRYPVRPSVSPLANVGALTGAVRFAGANATTLNNPATLQQTTANLACALRVPLENVMLTNITQRTATGTTVIPFDPRVATLTSNGTVVCYTRPPANATVRQLRRLSTTDSEVVVDYVLVDPDAGLLSMDPETFSATLAADPSVQDLAVTLGSSSVTVDAPPELALATSGAQAPPSATTAPSLSNYLPGILGGVIGAFVVGGVLVGAVFLFMNKRNPYTATATGTLKPTSSVVVIQTAPIESMNPMVKAPVEVRQTFDPQAVRGARV